MKRKRIAKRARLGSQKEGIRLTRPPRLEGAVKNAKMNPIRKKKGVYHKAKLKKIARKSRRAKTQST